MPLWVCLTCLLDDEMMPSDACAADGGDGVRDNAATARLRRTPMSITVRIPTPLRKITQDEDVVTAEGGTLLELIADLDTHYPECGRACWMKAGRFVASSTSSSTEKTCASFPAWRLPWLRMTKSASCRRWRAARGIEISDPGRAGWPHRDGHARSP